MASEPRTLADLPRTAWAWVALQIVDTLVGILLYYGGAMFTMISLGFSTLLIVFFLRASRWVWWLSVVVSVVGIVQGPLEPGWSLMTRLYDVAFWLTSLCLLLTPSVRRHFF